MAWRPAIFFTTKAFIAEQCYHQMLMTAQAYKVHVLQAQRQTIKATQDTSWFQHHASKLRDPRRSNPDWYRPAGVDSTRHFPAVLYNPVADISICLLMTLILLMQYL